MRKNIEIGLGDLTFHDIVLSLIAFILLFLCIEIYALHDSIKYDYRPEKNIHFNRWYDVSMFKGTQLNIDEVDDFNPFELKEINKNMMDGTDLNLIRMKKLECDE